MAKYALDFSATPDNLPIIRHFVQEHLAPHVSDPVRRNQLTVAVEELCANSIIHGNHSDPAQKTSPGTAHTGTAAPHLPLRPSPALRPPQIPHASPSSSEKTPTAQAAWEYTSFASSWIKSSSAAAAKNPSITSSKI
jgi:hypothetical protein